MPRHNLNKYNPAQDSTPGFRQQAGEERVLILNRAGLNGNLGCPCGCEQTPTGGKSTFVMGHDARLRGKLQRAHLTDTPVRMLVQRQQQSGDKKALEMAREFGDSFVRGVQEAVDYRTRQNRRVLNKALNSKRLIKVGRWEYTGQVVAVYGTKNEEEFEVEFVTRTGQIKRTRVPAAEAPLAGAQGIRRVTP